jgi:hypothetical protein
MVCVVALGVAVAGGGCEGGATGPSVAEEDPSVVDPETDPSAQAEPPVDPARRTAGSSGADGGDDEPSPTADPDHACVEHAACFSWCGTRFHDGSCVPAQDGEIDAEAYGPLLCPAVVLEVEAGEVRLADGIADEDARCFMQVLRYGNEGVVELFWYDVEGNASGHLVVQGLGGHYASIDLQLAGVRADCGPRIAMTAPMAYVRGERDPLFDGCLDGSEDIDPATCLLGPGADFFTDHDWVFEVAFPWLAGPCGVGP